MKLKIVFIHLVLSTLIISCRTIREKDFIVTNPLGDLLPPMEGNIDLFNLKDKISYGEVKISGRYNGIIQIRKNADSLNIFIYDPNVQKVRGKVRSLSLK
ncbi:MAG: hypothetical protein CVU96_07030 [Firmicutes bacterium HGW-Firmicutes-20]|jgi:hypothetical protein|nr:MAG: hypothetical protein CVU96_07030 [Firmicutes bacterium HGW-Firmicutes-20]PKP17259.1 MAG: hypothetical protein CVU05_15845 [Bacteroidetes bacterium HGW-Bacteroidetes-21]